MQGCRIVAQPARCNNAPATLVEAGQRRLQRLAVQMIPGAGFEHPRRLAAIVLKVGNRRKRVLVVVARFERQIVPRESRFHLDHFFRLDAQLMRNIGNLQRRQRLAARLHAAQIEEQLALRLGCGHFDHAPVLQHIFMNFRLDPVHGKRHQTHTVRRVEALDRLHQTNIAFLDQIGVRKTVAKVAAGYRNDKAQVGKNQLACRFQILILAETRRQPNFFFRRKDGKLLRCLNVGLYVACRRDCRKSH